MKKVYIILIAMIMIFCLSLNNAQARSKFKDAYDLQIYMRQNFTYSLDKIPEPYFEYFQLPHILEFSKTGDCDDFATYSYAHLNQMNYEAKRYILWGEMYDGEVYGHAVTVFLDDDNTYSVFSNQIILKTNQVDPVEAIKDIYRKSWRIICEWHPIEYGLIMYKDFAKTVSFCEAKDIISRVLFFRSKLGDYYDKKESYKKGRVLLSG